MYALIVYSPSILSPSDVATLLPINFLYPHIKYFNFLLYHIFILCQCSRNIGCSTTQKGPFGTVGSRPERAFDALMCHLCENGLDFFCDRIRSDQTKGGNRLKHRNVNHASARSPPEVSRCVRRTNQNRQKIPSETGRIFKCIKNDLVVRLELLSRCCLTPLVYHTFVTAQCHSCKESINIISIIERPKRRKGHYYV